MKFERNTMGRRILIADDLVTDRIAIKARLAAGHYRVAQARDRNELLHAARVEQPDAILMDIDFPGGGIEACRALGASPVTGDIPVVLYGVADDGATRIAAFDAGAEECLCAMPDERRLLAVLRSLLRARAERAELARRQALIVTDGLAEAGVAFEPPTQVTLVPPDPAHGPEWRRALEAAVPARVMLAAPANVLDPGRVTDAFVIAHVPGRTDSALGLVAELRARPATRHAIIIVTTPYLKDTSADQALDLGADAVMRGAFRGDELAARLRRLIARKRETDRLRALVEDQLGEALRDPLTGLFNRRYAECYLSRVLREPGRGACALLMLDLDHFKAVNDQYGHLAGDDVLRETACRLRGALRDTDLVARIGGEEFLVVLTDTGPDMARRMANRLRRAVSAGPMPACAGTLAVPVTVSIGVAPCDGGSNGPRAMMERADRALYASKAAGRNRVTFTAERSAA
jgi:two-component system cell cycle response regulator